MRIILFRGKRIDNGEWVYGHLFYEIVQAKGSYDGVTEVQYLIQSNDCPFDKYRVIAHTIGQYTGKYDKNDRNRNIYEGDLYKIKGDIYKVEFRDYRFMLVGESNSKYLDLDFIDCSDAEYIGDIFEKEEQKNEEENKEKYSEEEEDEED